jgi:hypothetical protein
VAFFGGDGVTGNLWFTSNYTMDINNKSYIVDHSLEKVYEISKSMICLFEDANDAMMIKLTWF